MDIDLFSSDLWAPALNKYAEATGLTVELYSSDARLVLSSSRLTPLVALFREFGFDPGLFEQCAGRCVRQMTDRHAIAVAEGHGLTVVGTSLVLEGAVVGAAVAGYALSGFSQVPSVQRWARAVGVPFDRLWSIVRQKQPVPERRLMLHGELLQVLGDALLRENYRTRQYEEAAAKLRAADAAKDEFLAVLSHELRNPLAAIAGWGSVLKTAHSMEDVQRAGRAIERNAFVQSRMVDDLLDVSRIIHGTMALQREVLELPALIRAAVETSSQEIEKKALRLEVADPGEPLLVEGDAVRLQQVFSNVVSNAVKFTPKGGRISISLGREDGQALVRVADTGRGISPEFLPSAFDIFRQQARGTRRGHEGLGIGLALVKRITELHQGTVSISSAGVGRGTEVSIRLPLSAGPPASRDAVAGAPEPAARGVAGLSVLVVEDSDDARESLRQRLHGLGARVAVARDGREALDLMSQGVTPDVVLCDLLMPRLDGFELVRELDRGPVHAPVVAVSGLGSEASRERAGRGGFAGYVKKPFDDATLIAAIDAALSPR